MPVLLIIVAVAFVFACAIFGTMARDSTLNDWARDNQFKILRREDRHLPKGPFFFSGKGFHVYYITVRTPAGQRRHGYVRVGRSFPFLPYRVDVAWD